MPGQSGQPEDHRIHVEFADFSQISFFKIFEKYVVRNANSLGMNEIELSMLIEYWKKDVANNRDERVLKAMTSKPSFEDILG